MKQLFGLVLTAVLMLVGISSNAGAAPPFLEVAKQTGISIIQDGAVTAWTGTYGGKMKPNGPLAGKKIGLVVACEFSDWQAYYFAEYLAEFGGSAQFVLDNNSLWKSQKPMIGTPTEPYGMWGFNINAGMKAMGIVGKRVLPPVVLRKGEGSAQDLAIANPDDYDAIIILGGHAGDIMQPDQVALKFIKAVADRNVPVAAIGGGILPLIKLKVVNGKNVTGNRVVDFMLNRVASFRNESVVTDGKLITGRDTVDSPAVLRALCKAFDPKFEDKDKDVLKGRRIMAMIANDFEDIEFCAPVMELIYRGADLVVGLFDPEMMARPPLLGLDVRLGNFGASVPMQEIPGSYYKIIKKQDLKMSDFDVLYIPGGFNPWQLTVLHREFIADAYAAGKLIAPICHGPIAVAAAGVVQGKKLTGISASEDAITIMGGTFMREWAAAIDGQIVSGRSPSEVPEFVDAITTALLK